MEKERTYYTAREVLEIDLEKYSQEKRENIKILAETKNYILIGTRNEENTGKYLRVVEAWRKGHDFPKVYIDQDYKGKIEKVEINWSAWGSQDIETTKGFVEDLKIATEFAEMINEKDYSEKI